VSATTIASKVTAERQYALRQRAIQLGWPVEQIVVIDTDQGQSGASAADREGFQRLVADVGLGKAGIVLGLEVSRLARNNADWHRLLEISALAGTLICDEDGLYDPADFNDRLLLGLKGTMSEAELHFIRARLQSGILSKARRGELPMPLPVGLVYDSAQKVVLDPDRAVQDALRHLFATFARTGSARAVVYAFNHDGLLFPSRIRKGARNGELAWNELSHWRVLRTLHNPRYAGAFASGRRRTRKAPNGTTSSRDLPREQWTALIHDAHPGYLTWEQFEHNQRLFGANAQALGTDRAAGPAREGPALLQGLAICGRCGKRLSIRYHRRRDRLVPDYQCVDENIQRHAPRYLAIPGHTIDRAISQLLLDTVTPLALEVALTVQTELEARANEADQLRRTHVERARQHADLARRRYLSVDPDSRLVADTLEADWNDALRALQAAQDEYDRQTATANATLDEKRKSQIRELATDFPKLWSDPETPARERKRIAPTIDRGRHPQQERPDPPPHPLPRRPDDQPHHPDPAQLLASTTDRPRHPAMLDRLLDDHTDAETAEQLNTAGRRTGMNKPFTRPIVVHLRRAHDLPSHADRLRARGMLTINQTAERLGVHPSTIKAWHHAGLLTSHKANDKNRTALRPARPPRPTPHSAPRLAPARPRTHATNPTRCTMKSTPCRTRRRGSPSRPRSRPGRRRARTRD
jgi:DNA invertase Pin-like site-specific DNA recombinase